jgi:hypothetical protein
MFIVGALMSLLKKAMALFRKKRSEEWLTPQIYTGKSMCEMGTCDCDQGKCNCCGWAICKGCAEVITQDEYDEGKGWCRLCIALCKDCMDEEKYPDGP